MASQCSSVMRCNVNEPWLECVRPFQSSSHIGASLAMLCTGPVQMHSRMQTHLVTFSDGETLAAAQLAGPARAARAQLGASSVPAAQDVVP